VADARTVDAVVFDLGGVLIDWNPRHLYRKMFETEEEIDHFLTHVCNRTWHEQQDAGGSAEDATARLCDSFPHFRTEIEAFYGRFSEMLSGPIAGSVDVLAGLRSAGVPMFALSNWPTETFPAAEPPYHFLDWFDGLVVSGREGVKKPDPRIFEILCERHGLTAAKSLFIDDMDYNIEAAAALGFLTHHFTDAPTLHADLQARALLPGA
jgi:2-haloacid dehalogenase